ncbi:MAG TPA: tetratricopeptide repeat protein [Thermoanaerobaculia bacterium]|nr:tetratricopeptide repeat protein [Thermoanaerobaculia bacterium]
MSRRRTSAFLLAGWLGLGVPLPWSWPPHLPARFERWLYNSRERINAAIAEARKGDAASRKRAIEKADTALRLAPGDTRIQYDAGTLHLAGGDASGAAEILDRASRAAGPELATAAAYNLGNARLAAEEPDAAIAAYERALRLDPANQDAKWNLELALKEREKQRQMKGPGGANAGGGGGGAASRQPGADQRGNQKNNSPNADQGQQKQQQAGGSSDRQGGQGSPAPRPGDQPLPQFKNQPDMTAAEAAALLESVENLERQQRKNQAAQRAQRRSAKGKDW